MFYDIKKENYEKFKVNLRCTVRSIGARWM